MAVALASGILFATMITLVLVPALYVVLEDVKLFFGFQTRHTSDDPMAAVLAD
jgi:hypothetical protein